MARIAIIDDSRLMRSVLKRFLVHLGHEVLEWEPSSALEVMEWTKRDAPDLLFTDYQMPGANGATVARMARKGNPNLPIICLTALRDPEVLEQLRKVPVTAILSKPVDEAKVAATLADLLT